MLGNFPSVRVWRLWGLTRAVWEGVKPQISAPMMSLLILELFINQALAEKLKFWGFIYLFRAFLGLEHHLLDDHSKPCFLPAPAENPKEAFMNEAGWALFVWIIFLCV